MGRLKRSQRRTQDSRQFSQYWPSFCAFVFGEVKGIFWTLNRGLCLTRCPDTHWQSACGTSILMDPQRHCPLYLLATVLHIATTHLQRYLEYRLPEGSRHCSCVNEFFSLVYEYILKPTELLFLFFFLLSLLLLS